MTTFLQSPSCFGCGNCICGFLEQSNTGAGDVGTFNEDFAAGSNFWIDGILNISVHVDVGSLTFKLYADGVQVYTSGVIGVGTTTGTANIPAGTVTITAQWIITVAVGESTYADINC